MRDFALIDGGPGAFGVVFPDLPGCVAMADTLDHAMTSATAALGVWINTVEANGGAVPAARSADTLRGDPKIAQALADGASLAAVLLVCSTGKPVRANLSLDEGVVSAIDAAARARGITQSAMVEILARQHLPEMA